MTIDELEKQGALQVLVVLYKWREETKPNISDLNRLVKATRETILTTIKLLKKTELVEDYTNPNFPFAHSVWLTEKGKLVAERLIEIARVLRRPK